MEILIYFYLNKNLDSLRSLVRDLKNNNLGLKAVAYSTLKDAFDRFNFETFQAIFCRLLTTLVFVQIPELAVLGKICLVDGSVFPLSIRAEWAEHRKNKKAIKLHLFWDLNGMVAENLIITKAIASEIEVLQSQIKAGITYVCDRGYVSFDLFKNLCETRAYFIIRLKKYNILEVIEENRVKVGFISVRDQRICFKNDPNGIEYRLIVFKTVHGKFKLLTNRFDLKTEEIVLMYSCRWQVELIFRFIKRTLGMIHLINEGENGLSIQFYVMQIAYLLMLNLRQGCRKALNEEVKQINLNDLLINPVTSFGERTKDFWKIGKAWLEKLVKLLDKRVTKIIIKELSI